MSRSILGVAIALALSGAFALIVAEAAATIVLTGFSRASANIAAANGGAK